MNLVGANSSFIRKPFLQNAGNQGLISGLIGSIMIIAVFIWFNSTFQDIDILSWAVIGFICIGLILFGIIISIVSTYIIVNLYLKRFSAKP